MGGWEVFGTFHSDVFVDGCDVVELSEELPSVLEFAQKCGSCIHSFSRLHVTSSLSLSYCARFLHLNRPVIVRQAMHKAHYYDAPSRFALSSLLQEHGHHVVAMGTIPYFRKFNTEGRRATLAEFIHQHVGRSSVYSFDSSPCDEWLDCNTTQLLPPFVSALATFQTISEVLKAADLDETRTTTTTTTTAAQACFARPSSTGYPQPHVGPAVRRSTPSFMWVGRAPVRRGTTTSTR
jgi:hypothetical protein